MTSDTSDNPGWTTKRAALAAAVLLLVSGAACRSFAAEDGRGGGTDATGAFADILAVNNSVSVAYQSMYLNYGEPSNGQLSDAYLDTERGVVSRGGFAVALSGMQSSDLVSNLYFQASFSRVTGYVTYSGHLNNPPVYTPVIDTTGEQINDWGLRVGKGFAAGERFLFTPYLAGGYHTWSRTLGIGTAGMYTENYDHYTLQFGNMIQYNPFTHLVLTADGQFGTTLSPHISVPSAQLDSKLGTALAFGFGFDIDYALWRKFHSFLGYRYSRFSYMQSGPNVTGTALEPISSTDTSSYLAGLRYSF